MLWSKPKLISFADAPTVLVAVLRDVRCNHWAGLLWLRDQLTVRQHKGQPNEWCCPGSGGNRIDSAGLSETT
jgi:hypothetical protein